MTLSFKTSIKNKPTYFAYKIIKGLLINELWQSGHTMWPQEIFNFEPKLHTIRADRNNRWAPGKNIHFVVNNRTPKRFQFVPFLVPVVSIQEIEIDNLFYDKFSVTIDNTELNKEQIETLAINDGFSCVEDFWNFFSGDVFIGKIIHWTNLKY